MMNKIIYIMILSIIFAGCSAEKVVQMDKDTNEKLEEATFAGGCFWCMEAGFEGLDGVVDVISGYAGGNVKDPTYEQVSEGTTGHREAINITFNPEVVSYDELLNYFWRSIDPTDAEGQFSDRGEQYKSAIYYHNEEQKQLAEESKKALDESGKFDKPIVTEIIKFTNFYKAEEYHQDYSKKRTIQYKIYETGSGRKGFIKKTWGE